MRLRLDPHCGREFERLRWPLRRAAGAIVFIALVALCLAAPARAQVPVDLHLLLAVDASGSVD